MITSYVGIAPLAVIRFRYVGPGLLESIGNFIPPVTQAQSYDTEGFEPSLLL